MQYSVNLKTLASAAVLAGAVVSAPSQAASLIGNSITAQYFYPDLATVYTGFTVSPSPTFVVGDGVDATGSVDGLPMDFDFASSSMKITLGADVGWSGATYNGWKFTNESGNFGSISSVTGIDASRVTVSGNVLTINWQGVNFANGDAVSVAFGVVPEPASWALMIGGFGLVGAAMRRRRATVPA